MDFFFWGYRKEQVYRTSLLLARIKKNASSILWKKSLLKYAATLSRYMNTGWTLCEQQRELRQKCSEMVKVGKKKSEWLFRVVTTVLTWLCLFSQQNISNVCTRTLSWTPCKKTPWF
jgi:hypothetical protein